MTVIKISKETPSPISTNQIKSCVETLLAVLKKEPKKQGIIAKPKFVLTVTVHKVSAKKNSSTFIQLPNAVYSKNTEICFFTKDVDKTDIEASERYWSDHFQKYCGFSPDIVPLRSLNTNYKSYESRRKLCNSYELFFADKKITSYLPSKLGGYFYNKRKYPTDVGLGYKSLPAKMESILSSTKWLNSGNGNSSQLVVALSTHTEDQIKENVQAAVKAIAKSVHRGWENIRSIYLKSENSMALPLFQNEILNSNLAEFSKVEITAIERKKQMQANLQSYGLAKRSSKRTNPSKRDESLKQSKKAKISDESDNKVVKKVKVEEAVKDQDDDEEEELDEEEEEELDEEEEKELDEEEEELDEEEDQDNEENDANEEDEDDEEENAEDVEEGDDEEEEVDESAEDEDQEDISKN